MKRNKVKLIQDKHESESHDNLPLCFKKNKKNGQYSWRILSRSGSSHPSVAYMHILQLGHGKIFIILQIQIVVRCWNAVS
jgi:hypothetical protein